MRRQCRLVKIQDGVYTHVNKHRPHAAAFRVSHPSKAVAGARLIWQHFKGMAKEVGKHYGQRQGTTGTTAPA